jgi:hypothetical protein
VCSLTESTSPASKSLPSTGQVGYLVLIKDAKIEEMADHTFAVQKGITMGLALFILSEALFLLQYFLGLLPLSSITYS